MDSTTSVSFSLSDAFLACLSGNSIMFSATAGVEDWFNRGVSGTDTDYVKFSLSFDEATSNAINAPASIIMLLGGILIVAAYRRKN